MVKHHYISSDGVISMQIIEFNKFQMRNQSFRRYELKVCEHKMKMATEKTQSKSNLRKF